MKAVMAAKTKEDRLRLIVVSLNSNMPITGWGKDISALAYQQNTRPNLAVTDIFHETVPPSAPASQTWPT
jgi:hypothetical protein